MKIFNILMCGFICSLPLLAAEQKRFQAPKKSHSADEISKNFPLHKSPEMEDLSAAAIRINQLANQAKRLFIELYALRIKHLQLLNIAPTEANTPSLPGCPKPVTQPAPNNTVYTTHSYYQSSPAQNREAMLKEQSLKIMAQETKKFSQLFLLRAQYLQLNHQEITENNTPTLPDVYARKTVPDQSRPKKRSLSFDELRTTF